MKKTTSTAILFALALTAGGGAAAQTNFKAALSTLTNYGNYAQQGNTIGFKSVAKSSSILAGHTLSVGANVGAGGVDTIVGWNHWTGDIITVDVSEQGAASVGANEPPFRGGSTAAASASRIVPSRHSLLLQIGGTPGARAILEFWGGGVTDDGVGVEYAYDVGDNGTTDFAFGGDGSDSRILPVRIPASGVLAIAIHSAVKVGVPAGKSVRYKTGASLRFSPAPHCAVLPYGPSCGPLLSGRFSRTTPTGQAFALSYTNAQPHAPSILVIGTHRLHVRLPGTTCPLLTDPRVVALFAADANGSKLWSFSLPAVLDLDIKMQGADLSGGTIKPSNGLQVFCLQ